MGLILALMGFSPPSQDLFSRQMMTDRGQHVDTLCYRQREQKDKSSHE
jgi:hypothetical protein